MVISARLSWWLQSLTRIFLYVSISLFIFLFFSLLFSHKSYAAVQTVYPMQNLDAGVEHTQHTYVQTMLFDVFSSAMCIIVGVDPVNPDKPCLDINPKTGKLGFVQTDQQNGEPQLGGLIGSTTDMIAGLYTPTVTTQTYMDDLAANFGIVKPAQAQGNDQKITQWGYGFVGLQPILRIWKEVLNIAYLLLALFFLIIGLGIMLRVRIDPRTVMTIQNQIPRIIICVILITFSYVIAAAMIDMMWMITYVGINRLTDIHNPYVEENNTTLSQKATSSLLETPILYVHDIFDSRTSKVGGGIGRLSWKTSQGMGTLMKQLIRSLFSVDDNAKCFKLGFPPKIDMGQCFAGFIGGISTIVFLLIIFCVILIALFRTWFMLLKAYLFTLMYIILAPLWIVFGLLPGRPLGFEKWLRSLFSNLIVFPLVAILFVGARILMEVFQGNPQDKFIPPLVGNPHMEEFGVMLGFGAILMAPTLLDWVKDTMKASGNKFAGRAIGGGIAAGMAVAGAPAIKTLGNMTYRDRYTREPIGGLAVRSNRAMNKIARNVPIIGTRWEEARRQRAIHERWSNVGTQFARNETPGRFGRAWRNIAGGDRRRNNNGDGDNGGGNGPHGGGTPPRTPRPPTPPSSGGGTPPPAGGTPPAQPGGGGAAAPVTPEQARENLQNSGVQIIERRPPNPPPPSAPEAASGTITEPVIDSAEESGRHYPWREHKPHTILSSAARIHSAVKKAIGADKSTES